MTVDAGIVVGLNAVIVALEGDRPRVLTVSVPEGTPLEGGTAALERADGPGSVALPTGPLDPAGDRTLELALRRWVKAWSGLELGYVEQLYTFGDRYRDPAEREGGPRVISAAYVALTHQVDPVGLSVTRWRSIYPLLPWEDRRVVLPTLIEEGIERALAQWIDGGGVERDLRRERASLAFGLGTFPWDGERVLERYEILYETGLVSESAREGGNVEESKTSVDIGSPGLGLEMAFDHRRILATALGRIRAKIRYRPVIFELMPKTFTLLQLQRAVEALAGVRLHKQNFRRLVDKGGLVEGTGRTDQKTGGRPAELFRFRREVLLERPAPGVGLPGH
ncbi:MAG: NAD regulator [Acidobacteria bacterium]|nr:MAG: NAD regulator [Acidobacteriota bacterium]